ncbi:MAG: hypothetical protein KJ066_23410 [Acidobacteria bacterium]|nr:hypothetical protein [Acidobacteriota bacterium]
MDRPVASASSPDVDIFAYVQELRAKWVALLVGGLVIGGLTGVVTYVSPRFYEASATVQLVQSRLLERDARSITSDVVPLLASRAALDEILKAESVDPALSADEFAARFLSVEPGRDSSLVRVSVRYLGAEQAARLANAIAGRAVARYRGVIDEEAKDVLGRLSDQAETARQVLTAAEETLLQFQQTAQVEALRKDVEVTLELRAALRQTEVNLAAQRQKLEALEQSRANRSQLMSLARTIDSDALLSEVSRQQLSGEEGSRSSVLGLQLKSEFLNPVFETVDAAVVTTGAEVAELDQRKDTLTRQGVGRETLPKLAELYARESQRDTLVLRRDVARRSFERAVDRLEETRGLLVGRSPRLHLLEPAAAPTRPLPRNTVQKALIGGIGGLLLGALVVLFRRPSPA